MNKPARQISPVCGPRVQRAIRLSVDLMSKTRPKPWEFVNANLGIIDAALLELHGENLERAKRTRKLLVAQAALLKSYGVAA